MKLHRLFSLFPVYWLLTVTLQKNEAMRALLLAGGQTCTEYVELDKVLQHRFQQASAELEAPDRANHCVYNWIDGRGNHWLRAH
jgi:hypothetical protein